MSAADALKLHAAVLLPLAFVGSFDEMPVIKELWQQVWLEAVSGNEVWHVHCVVLH